MAKKYTEQKVINIKEGLLFREDSWLKHSKSRANMMNTITTIVIHWTAGSSINNAVETLKQRPASYHFIIGKDGEIRQVNPVSEKAWHAGSSYGPGGYDVNPYSIGISMDLLNSKEPISAEMYQSIIDLIKDLKVAVPSLVWITGHQWVAPGRKVDPYTFDFNKLIREPDIKAGGFKLWRTGDLPFPKGLNDCRCVKRKIPGDNTSKCLKSSGKCSRSFKKEDGTIVTYKYSKARLSNEVLDASDLTIDSDLLNSGE